MTHTPGPWAITARPKGYRLIGTDGKQRIATVEIRDEGESIDDANARLIAACPTMYAYIASKASGGDPEAVAIMRSLE